MFSGLRLRLTLLYLGAAAVLLTLLGVSTYGLVAGYFQTTTDDALQYKMAFEFRQLGAPIPPTLSAAAREITQQNATTVGGRTDSSELAAIFVLPLDNTGKALFNPNTFVLPISPDLGAAQAALRLVYDWRT